MYWEFLLRIFVVLDFKLKVLFILLVSEFGVDVPIIMVGLYQFPVITGVILLDLAKESLLLVNLILPPLQFMNRG